LFQKKVNPEEGGKKAKTPKNSNKRGNFIVEVAWPRETEVEGKSSKDACCLFEKRVKRSPKKKKAITRPTAKRGVGEESSKRHISSPESVRDRNSRLRGGNAGKMD